MKKSIKLVIALFVILMIFLIYIKFKNDTNEDLTLANKMSSIFEKIDKSTTAKITKYFVYGTHLNLEGNIEIPKISKISIDSAHIILNNTEQEIILDTNFTYKDNILTFSTTEILNKGISLESLTSSNNYIFLKIVFSSSEEKYFSLSNNSSYDATTYYTISSNKKIDINFDTYNNLSYLKINCLNIDDIPDDVYDIVIDASHGGNDSGAKSGNIKEAEIVLECSKILKQKLEEAGFKVFLTRDGAEANDVDMKTNMYDENGRINTAQKSNAKLLISLNINDEKSKTGGVEIYAPTNCNLDFAKLIANNIVKSANTSYSESKPFKSADGVYVRPFTNADIKAFEQKAKLGKYEPYNITTSTPYLYMIRETGGIATNAFIDGRNKNYGKNLFINSNVGIESYSIELGYMTVSNDLENIMNNKDLYMEGIANAIKEFYT